MIFLTAEDEFKIQPKLQLLYFYASWMPYHKKMITMISKMETNYSAVDYCAIDVDYFKSFIKRFAIDSVPTILILNNGKEIKRINGLILTSALKSVFVDICKV